MDKFLLSERYRLELHWQSVERPQPGLMVLTGAYFSGPVLGQAIKLNDNDMIRLDFCDQHFVIVNNVYISDFSWGRATYADKKIHLKPAVMKFDPELKGVPNLVDTDHLVIDTEKHEVSKHAYNMVYPAFVINRDEELYDYRR